MTGWIRIAAWVLIAFAAPGLVYSAATLDGAGVAINGALLAIGILDLRSLRLVPVDPARGWGRIVWTQFALGVVIWISMILLGRMADNPKYWEIPRRAMEMIYGKEQISDAVWDYAMSRTKAIFTWGMAIGGAAVFLGQLRVCWKLRRLAQSPAPSRPPPLPANSQAEKR